MARAWSARRHPALLPVLLAGVLLSGGLWAVWLVQELSGPVNATGHHDFLALYAAGTLIRTHGAQLLYNPSAITALERHVYPHPTGYAGYMPYLNPPSVAVLLAPFTWLSEPTARIAWLLLSVVIAVICIALIAPPVSLKLLGLTSVAVLWTFPAYQTLVEGQWSFVMLLGALVALRLAGGRRDVLAGIALLALWIKPPLLLLVIVWCLITGRWQIAASAVAATVLFTAVTLPLTGVQADVNYFGYLVNVGAAHASGGGAAGPTAWEGAFANMEGLLGLSAALVGQQHPALVDGIAAALAAAMLGILAWAAQRHRIGAAGSTHLAVAALLTGLLLDPHLYAQDCVLLLVPVALWLWRWNDHPSTVVAPAVSRRSAALLVLTCLVMDAAAIDTLWSQGLFPLPLHLFTACLIGTALWLAGHRHTGELSTNPERSSLTSNDLPELTSASP